MEETNNLYDVTQYSDDELYDYKLPDNFHQMMEEMNNEMKNKN